jgi:hypothetical protein
LNNVTDKVEKHSIDIERIKTYGSFAVLIIPIIASIIIKVI